MNLVLNEEQRLLKDTARDLLKNSAPVASMRALRDTSDGVGYSEEFWQQLVELGIPSITLPQEFGGLGFGYLGLGAVLEEMGRNLTATPLLSTIVLGASAIELGGSEAQRESLLPEIASGKLTLALAIDEVHHHQPLNTGLKLDSGGAQMTLSGKKVFVQDGNSADKMVVVARSSGTPGSENGLSMVLVDRKTAGVEVQKTTLMDGRNAANIHFDNVTVDPADVVGDLDGAWPVLQEVLDRGTICLAAEMLGGALETFERTIDYIKQREQFDVKIGSFQALQHRSAKMFCQLEHCKSVVLAALSALDTGSNDISLNASLAKALCNQCFKEISNEAIQMHGGMGISDELDIGLFLKRSRVSTQMLGDTSYHRDRYARLSGY